MKVMLSFVPPGGGETDYSLQMELPEIPRPGDYIAITRENGDSGTENFIVKRTWWKLRYREQADHGSVDEIWVECEFALSPWSSESHKRACERYKNLTGKLLKLDETMY